MKANFTMNACVFNVSSPREDLTHDANHPVVPFIHLADLDGPAKFLASTVFPFSSYRIFELAVPSMLKLVELKLRRLQRDVLVPEELRQDRRALETKIESVRNVHDRRGGDEKARRSQHLGGDMGVPEAMEAV